MIEVIYDRGTYLPGCDLWLDPQTTRPFAFISQAYNTQGTHGGHHHRTILTEATARLMRGRLGSGGKIQHTLRYGEQRDFGTFRATLFPGGHVLGSAQILIEQAGEYLLYTGDLKLRRDPGSEFPEGIQVKSLLMDTTYGHPKFKFPLTEKTLKRMVIFCQETLAASKVPVLLGFSLGKAQEIFAALAGADLPVMLHGSIWPMMRLYEQMGEVFPPYGSFDPGSVAGHVLLAPLATERSALLEQLPSGRVAMITGKKIDKREKARHQCDEVFPLSDHADYRELMELVDRVKPERVFTLNGFAAGFASDLRKRGLESWALTGANQMDFSI